MSFPENFVWGAAASSYQIEGGACDDGKGLSIWDMLCRQPGKIWSDNTGDIACDHYHKYDDDVQLMAQIGLKAYRLSISWPRVMPGGRGEINEKGLDFYDRLVDSLLKNNIEPWITLFHWDFPYTLYCRGGWLNRDSSEWFANYTKVVVDKLSDRVSHWITQNEPQCFIGLGHQTGEHAPGLKLGFADVLLAAHHSLLAHGKAVQGIRTYARTKPLIGTALAGVVKTPFKNSYAEIEAARQCMFAITMRDCWNNTWFADPIVLGRYPADGLKLFEEFIPEIKNGDMETICQPLDFYGVNIYTGQTVLAAENGSCAPAPHSESPPLTAMEWEVKPEALYWGGRFLYERYGLPVVVTENGMANCDWIHSDGKVHDPQRIDFHTRYLCECSRLIDEGVPCNGYFLWSVMDNFEWAQGYKQKFGIIYVDFDTGKRTLKDSAFWYSDVIRSNGRCLNNSL